uniref:Cytochrome P450 n=1 Tax=Kalanchoe fedtschenkoi TaxID=63787 RepID=A0A7N0U4K9_KALFE
MPTRVLCSQTSRATASPRSSPGPLSPPPHSPVAPPLRRPHHQSSSAGSAFKHGTHPPLSESRETPNSTMSSGSFSCSGSSPQFSVNKLRELDVLAYLGAVGNIIGGGGWTPRRLNRPERFVGFEGERDGYRFIPIGVGRMSCPGAALGSLFSIGRGLV